jgi:hypothetical protein
MAPSPPQGKIQRSLVSPTFKTVVLFQAKAQNLWAEIVARKCCDRASGERTKLTGRLLDDGRR